MGFCGSLDGDADAGDVAAFWGDSALDWGTGHQKSVQMNAAARNATLDQRTISGARLDLVSLNTKVSSPNGSDAANCIAEYKLDIKYKMCKVRIEVKLHGVGFRPYP